MTGYGLQEPIKGAVQFVGAGRVWTGIVEWFPLECLVFWIGIGGGIHRNTHWRRILLLTGLFVYGPLF